MPSDGFFDASGTAPASREDAELIKQAIQLPIPPPQ